MLTISFHGWGDRGFIDTFGSEAPSITICATCAIALRQARSELNVLDQFLNINYSHVCEDRDGAFVAESQSECTASATKHGWIDVFVVRPECTCGPKRRMTYGVFATEDEADEFARGLASRGHATKTERSLLGNATSFYAAPTPPA